MQKLKFASCLTVALLTSCAATGCATVKPTPPAPTPVQIAMASTVPDFCATAKPIYISRNDVLTDQTAAAILAHNLTGRKLCGW